MQSLNKENMKFVSGGTADDGSLLDNANSFILVIVAKPDDLGKIQDFFNPQTSSQAEMGDQTQSQSKTPFNSSQAQPVARSVLPQAAA